MKEIRFRAWNTVLQEMLPVVGQINFNQSGISRIMAGKDNDWLANGYFNIEGNDLDKVILMQFTGLHDKDGKEIYRGDICRFPNGDTCIVRCEEWVEFYGEWIGEPECEDQLRDWYRIGKSTIIGNRYENPELLPQQ